MIIRTQTATADLVPLADRVRWMRICRVAAAFLVLITWFALPETRDVQDTGLVLTATGAYLAVCLGADLVWHLTRRRALFLFGALLLIDGIYFAIVTHLTGQFESPLRYLILLHLVSVALLASFRTGLKVAFWHALLILCAIYAQEAGLLDDAGAPSSSLDDPAFRTTIAFITACWLTTIAASAFAAVNERELRRRRFDLEALARLGLRLEGTADLASVGEALTDSVVDELSYERVLLFAVNGREIVLVAHHGVERGGHAFPQDAQQPSLVARAAAERRTLLISKFVPADDERLAALMPDARNVVLVPLQADGHPVGVMVCEHTASKGSRIERRVVSMLERFCSQGGLAMANARLVEQLERAAATDGLTGIANRRTFDLAIGREISRAQRTGDHFSVALLDIDHFKQVNDVHGHLVGDDVLRRLAQALDSELRGEDMIARLGGEEFAVLLPMQDSAEGLVAAERLRVQVTESLVDLNVTASFGVATLPADGTDANTLLDNADRALYFSKRNGRNRVTSTAQVVAGSHSRG